MTFHPEAFMTMMNIQLILTGKITFGEAEVMDGIQQIGFTNSITAADTNNAFGELKLLVKIVLELKQRYGIQAKAQC
jgi:hypothetical protein